MTPELIVGDTFRIRAQLQAGKPSAAYDLTIAQDITAAIVSADHCRQLSDCVTQSRYEAGADWPGGIVTVKLPAAATGGIAHKGCGRALAVLELQATMDNEKYSWFAPVWIIPGRIA